jgi:mannitol-specific phosphotransferase system IIBC component
MTAMDSTLKFLGSKWFTLILGIALMCVLPFTYHNFEVVYKAGQMSGFWYLVAVFLINIIGIVLCIYKFMGSLGKKDVIQTQEW